MASNNKDTQNVIETFFLRIDTHIYVRIHRITLIELSNARTFVIIQNILPCRSLAIHNNNSRFLDFEIGIRTDNNNNRKISVK